MTGTLGEGEGNLRVKNRKSGALRQEREKVMDGRGPASP